MTAGTNPVGAWALPYSTGVSVQDPTTYKGNLDACFAVAQRVADAFAPQPSNPAAMTVAIDPGFIVSTGPAGLQVITEVAAQVVTITAAPGSPNNRLDLLVVDEATGTATAIAGTPATSPSAPAITAGKKQIGLVSVLHTTTVISNGNITDLRAVWGTTVPGIRWAVAGGSADVITAAYTPANASLVDGLILGFRATAANATTTPSFNPDGLGAKTITKKGGAALLAGDIPGALAECLVRYNAANTRWELINPAVALPTIGAGDLLANATGSPATATDTTLTALIDQALGNTNNDVLQRVSGSWTATTLTLAIDNAIGSTRGAILERGASGWSLIAPNTAGHVFTDGGSGADPSWQAPTAPTTYLAVGTPTLVVDTIGVSSPSPWAAGTTYTGGVMPSGVWRCMSVPLVITANCCTATWQALFVRVS